MGKILESLPNTVIAGIVLTLVAVLVAPMIAGGGDTGTAEKAATAEMEQMSSEKDEVTAEEEVTEAMEEMATEAEEMAAGMKEEMKEMATEAEEAVTEKKEEMTEKDNGGADEDGADN